MKRVLVAPLHVVLFALVLATFPIGIVVYIFRMFGEGMFAIVEGIEWIDDVLTRWARR